MTTVQAIEAVKQLPPADLAAFRRWFFEFDEAEWDAKIEADAHSGKFDAMAAEALAESHTEHSRAL